MPARSEGSEDTVRRPEPLVHRTSVLALPGQCPYLCRGENPIHTPTIFGHDLWQEKIMTTRRRSGMKTIDKLLSNEGINAAAVMALSGTLMVMVAKGGGPLSLGRVSYGVLSNPVPKGAPGNRRYSSVAAPPQQIAA